MSFSRFVPVAPNSSCLGFGFIWSVILAVLADVRVQFAACSIGNFTAFALVYTAMHGTGLLEVNWATSSYEIDTGKRTIAVEFGARLAG